MGTSLLWQTDTQLHGDVQQQLEWDPEVEAGDVAVIASGGVITLTGLVHGYAVKVAAERAVKRVRGVRAVANDIQVALRRERTDSDIATDAMHALRVQTRVPDQVTVTVHHGFIALEGTVEWMFQKVAAEYSVVILDGVLGVSNLIRVKPSASANQFKTDIDDAFGRRREVDDHRAPDRPTRPASNVLVRRRRAMADTLRWESFRADGDQIIDTLKRLIHEGNIRRVVVEHDGRTVAEFPLTTGLAGILVAPALAAIGVIVAMMKDCTIQVERADAAPARPKETAHAA